MTAPTDSSRWPDWGRKRKGPIIIIGIIAGGAIIAALAVSASYYYSQQSPSGAATITEFAPAVRFVEFEPQKQEIRVGESAPILFNVQNSEDRMIHDARVVITAEPEETSKIYLSISNSSMVLPTLHKDARTGEITVSITASGTPATEAVYLVRGTILVESTKTDVREFQLTIRQ